MNHVICHILCSISHVLASTHIFFHVIYSILFQRSWLLHVLIYCLFGKGLLHKCCCRINPRVIQIKPGIRLGDLGCLKPSQERT